MLSRKEFVQMSLELNLFFSRIMKEHMILMEAGLSVKNSNYILEADSIKKSFEDILKEVIALSDKSISQEAIESYEFVTPFTLDAETITEALTGVCIDKEITISELELVSDPNFSYTASLEGYVFDLNNRIINLVIEIIKFKEKILAQVLECNLFIFIYPHMLEHLIKEAKFYLKALLDLQERRLVKKDILEKEIFWNHIMEDHAEFIRGFLDPTEKELLHKANEFAKLFKKLLEKTKDTSKEKICDITRENFKATKKIKEFKTDSTEGLIACEIKSIMSPLLADHVLREANRYIRILKEYLKEC